MTPDGARTTVAFPEDPEARMQSSMDIRVGLVVGVVESFIIRRGHASDKGSIIPQWGASLTSTR
jgi:hypothetical protein